MARVLLIDDDANLLDVLGLAFEEAGYRLETAADGTNAWRQIEASPPDVVVADVNMPGLDGFSLCRQVRSAGYALPFILLTSRDNEIDEALGLELGADDYVSKPFSTRVLLARVAALLRRQSRRDGPRTADSELLVHGSVVLDPQRLEVRVAEQPVSVTLTEFRLLETLVRHPGIVFSREQLIDRIRGDDAVVAPRIVDTYVRRLRRKLEAAEADLDPIETVVGAGYRWKDDG